MQIQKDIIIMAISESSFLPAICIICKLVLVVNMAEILLNGSLNNNQSSNHLAIYTRVFSPETHS
jgi:hypothetical protein